MQVQVEMKTFSPKMKGDMLPTKGTAGSAAIDLRVVLPEGEEYIEVEPGETVKVGTGLGLWINDPNFVGLVVPRSSSPVMLANTIGTIDSDYQGQIFLKLKNTGNKTVRIADMERLMQYMILPVESIQLNMVEEWSNQTARGEGGDGHTGKQ